MKLLDILTEVEVPPTKYGYWITDQGKFLTVPDHGHERVARRHFNADDNVGDFFGVGSAYDLGWIRIVDQTGFTGKHTIHMSVDDPRKIPEATLRAVLPYIRQSNPIRFWFENSQEYPQPEFRTPGMPTKQELYTYFLKLLTQNKKMVAEGDIPGTYYGYWITHTGEFLPVPREDHYWIAKKYFMDHPTEGDQGLDLFNRAYRIGWIRIIDDGRHSEDIHVTIWKPEMVRPFAVRSVLEYIRTIPRQRKIYFEQRMHAPKIGFQDPYYASKGELRKYFRSLLQRKKMVAEAEEIPYTDYGYWIAHTGKIIPVGYQEHEIIAKRIFKQPVDGALNSMGSAANRGWIRVIQIGGFLEVDLSRKTTKRALGRLIRLILDVKPNEIEVDVQGDHLFGDKFQRFTELSVANRYFRDLQDQAETPA